MEYKNTNYNFPKKISKDRTIIVTSVRVIEFQFYLKKFFGFNLKKNKIKDEPFFMFRENEEGKNWTGNDRFEGYCVDLTKRIAEVLNFTYELRLVKDNKFGSKDANGIRKVLF